jgi:DNA (cytosine-5)-methyltransferase 1
MNYYNEFDPKAAAWLQELINQKLIPNGKVDTRSITDVSPDELREFTQCHFFAGIGGWSLALQLAGWPEDRPVWSMSCPCQPFSTAGKQLGDKDERHLWPVAFNLIKECRPEYVFGEQVASAIGKGWLDGVSTDLGQEGYTCGSAVLGAHSVGAPHIRQRLYWVAYTTMPKHKEHKGEGESSLQFGGGGSSSRLGNASSERYDRQHSLLRQEDGGRDTGDILQAARSCEAGRLAQPSDNGTRGEAGKASGCGGESVDTRTESLRQDHGTGSASGADSRSAISGQLCTDHWDNCTLIPCRDGKTRRIPAQVDVEPVFQHVLDGFSCSLDARRNILNAAQGFPLAETIPGRVALLKGAGNAIVPQVAAEFIAAFMDIEATETALFY